MMKMLLNGNALRIPLVDKSVQCCVTSSPYWSLRDYNLPPLVWGGDTGCAHRWGDHGPAYHPGQVEQTNIGSKHAGAAMAGQTSGSGQFCQLCNAWRGSLGLEPTPELYVEHLVAVFREVRRVLRDDGTVWLNLGDSYCSGNHSEASNTHPSRGQKDRCNKVPGLPQRPSFRRDRRPREDDPHKSAPGLKPKDLVGIPWRVAFALQADGWWLRSDIIWHKPNGMPESVTDRPTKSHEYVFLLTKKARYYYDAEAIKEAKAQSTRTDPRTGDNGHRRERGLPGDRPDRGGTNLGGPNGDRNRRSVWTIPTQSYKGAHFATFPEKLVEPCILAGTSARGECPVCGKAWQRVVETKRDDRNFKREQDLRQSSSGSHRTINGVVPSFESPESITTGWRPQCKHYSRADEWQEFPKPDAGESDTDYAARMKPIDRIRQELLEFWRPMKTVPQTVLDPFSGTATVGKVAIKHRRRFVGLELNPDYIRLAEKRTRHIQVALL